jgi:hypothetical protein
MPTGAIIVRDRNHRHREGRPRRIGMAPAAEPIASDAPAIIL